MLALGYTLSLDSDYVLEESEKSGLVFRKELIHTGSFRDANNTEFTWDDSDIEVIYAATVELLADGETIPVVKQHTMDPEETRGILESVELGTNAKGQKSIYGRIRFRDAEAAKMAQTVQCSVWVPGKIQSGTSKKTYRYPIRHVALTDYPAINDLEGFDVVASLVPFEPPTKKDEDLTMAQNATLLSLAKSLEIEVKDEMTDEEIAAAIKAAKMPKEEKKTEAPAPKEEDPKPDVSASTVVPKHVMPMAAVKLVNDSRRVAINNLLTHTDGPKISKAAADELAGKFCSLKPESFDAEGNVNDGFDVMLSALAKNTLAVQTKEQSGAQDDDVLLSKAGTAFDNSNSLDPKHNFLLSAVEKFSK